MLFKYLPSIRVDVIKNLKIRFSPFESLNDPFESLPLYDSEFRKQHIDQVITIFKETMLQNKESKNTIITEIGDKLRETIENEFLSTATFGKLIMKNRNENVGILSLSRTEKSLLMWSHYSENGKGFVLGIDSNSTFFKKINGIGNPIPVVYSEKRRVFDISEHKIQEIENIPRIFSRKPLEWAYEEEERFFCLLNTENDDIDTGIIDEYGKKIILSNLSPEAIKCIYLGYNISNETKDDIIKSIKINNLKCKVFQGNICNKEYNVLFDELTL
jgi:hypothetical protein